MKKNLAELEEFAQQYIQVCINGGVPLSDAQIAKLNEILDPQKQTEKNLEDLADAFRLIGKKERSVNGAATTLMGILSEYADANHLVAVPIERVALHLYRMAREVIETSEKNAPFETDPFAYWEKKPHGFGENAFEGLQEYLIDKKIIEEKDRTYALKHVRIALGPFVIVDPDSRVSFPLHKELLFRAYGWEPGATKTEKMKAKRSSTNFLKSLFGYIVEQGIERKEDEPLTNADALDLYRKSIESIKRARTFGSNNICVGRNFSSFMFIGLHNYLVSVGLVVEKPTTYK